MLSSHRIYSKGLIVSACGLGSGGCHQFAVAWMGKYTQHTHIKAIFNGDIVLPNLERQTLADINFIVLTGCVLNQTELILDAFNYNLSSKKLYALLPTFIGHKHEDYRLKLLTCHYNIDLYWSGLEEKSIGIPKAIYADEKVSHVHDSYFGLLYCSIAPLATPKGQKFLEYFFSEIKKQFDHTNKTLPIKVLVVQPNDSHVAMLQLFAKRFDILLEISNRLTPGDFAARLKSTVKNRGLVACDGIQTLLETLSLKGRILFFSTIRRQANIGFIKHCINHIPPELRETAKVLLGMSEDFKITDTTQTDKVYHCLQTLVEGQNSHFTTLESHAIYSAPITLFSPIQNTAVIPIPESLLEICKKPLPELKFSSSPSVSLEGKKNTTKMELHDDEKKDETESTKKHKFK